jgi:hypothetical protein
MANTAKNEKQEQLLATLRVMFQFDQAELDFGVYRITERNDYLDILGFGRLTDDI